MFSIIFHFFFIVFTPDPPTPESPTPTDKYSGPLCWFTECVVACGVKSDATALTAAAGNGHSAIVAALLQAGPDINAGRFVSLLMILSFVALFEVIVIWIHVHQSNALCAAARGGYTETITMLLAAGADVTAKVEFQVKKYLHKFMICYILLTKTFRSRKWRRR